MPGNRSKEGSDMTRLDRCVPEAADGNTPATVRLANPAAVFCVESGGSYEICRATDGSESGVCIPEDGTKVDAWEYFWKKATR